MAGRRRSTSRGHRGRSSHGTAARACTGNAAVRSATARLLRHARALVAPDKFAGTLTAVEAARGDRRGLAPTAPDDELTSCRSPTAAPASSTCCTRRSAASCCRSRSPTRSAHPVPADVLLVDDGTAYVESAQACGLHLVAGRPSATRTGDHVVRAGRADRRRRRRRCAAGSWSGWAARRPTTAGAGLLAALGATAAPTDAARAGGGGRSALAADRPRLARRCAPAARRRAGRGHRRRQPAARACTARAAASAPQKGADARAGAGLDAALEHFAARPASGPAPAAHRHGRSRVRRRAPAPRGGLGFGAAAARRPAGAGIGRGRTPSGWATGSPAPTWWSPARALRPAVAARQGRGRGGRRAAQAAACRASCWPGRSMVGRREMPAAGGSRRPTRSASRPAGEAQPAAPADRLAEPRRTAAGGVARTWPR